MTQVLAASPSPKDSRAAVADASVGAQGSALIEMARAYQISQALYVAVDLDLADRLAEGPKSAAALAIETGSDPSALYRLLRMLAGRGLLRERQEQTFELTGADLLRRGVAGSVRDQVLLWGHPMQWAPWRRLLGSVRSGRPAFPEVFGQGHWDYLATHPETAALFKAAMAAHPSHHETPAAFDFSRFRRVVDVGGGVGQLLAAILSRHPALEGVLLDRPSVVADALPVLAAAGVAGRCRVVGGDFFDAMPSGADLYVFSNVMMDWADEPAVRLLTRCRSAMAVPGAVLLVERMLPEEPTSSLGFLSDLMGLVVTGGQMRTQAHFQRLFAAAGLAGGGAWQTGSGYTLLEARALPGMTA